MIDGIVKLFESSPKVVKKEIIKKSFEEVSEFLNDEVISALEEVVSNGSMDIYGKSRYLTSMNNGVTAFKIKDKFDIFVKLLEMFKEISANENKLKAFVDKLNPNITSVSITARDAAVVKVVNDLVFLSTYTLDLISMVITDEKDTHFPKIKFTNFEKELPTYVDYVNKYFEYERDIIKKLDHVSTTEINVSDSSLVTFLKTIVAKSGTNLFLPTGFVNNPIYHFRMWMMDSAVENYEYQKEKRKSISIKLNELKYKANGEENESLKKQIAYYEKQLADMEYKIEKFENS